MAVLDLDQAATDNAAAEVRSQYDVPALGIGLDVRDQLQVPRTLPRHDFIIRPRGHNRLRVCGAD